MGEKMKLEPMFGFAIVRVIEADETPGGVILPETGDQRTCVLESAASGYVVGGLNMPFNGQPGARVIPVAGAKMVTSTLLPPKQYMMRILDIGAYEVLSAAEA